MRQHEAELRERTIAVAVVTFDADVLARGYVEQTQLPWPLLIDSQRSVYRSYGLGRASAWAVYGPSSIWQYLKLIFGKGRRVPKPGSDYRQLGGDVLIDPLGMIRFYHASTTPHDRPTVNEILTIVQDEKNQTREPS